MSDSRELYWIYYCKDHRDYLYRKAARAFGFLWELPHPPHIFCTICGNPDARYVKSAWFSE